MTKIIAVIGATGAQGGGVVDALISRAAFSVRALTRRPDSWKAHALQRRGCEVVQSDLNDAASLERAFAGAHGVFLVTNAWDAGGEVDEYEQGKRAVKAAKAAGVQHLVWSTLPNCHAISGGKYDVRHFTAKARVDDEVRAAEFPFSSFVEAPMYFQNLVSAMMAPKAQPDGTKAWAFPMRADNRCIYNGDVRDVGVLVARVFENPEKAGQGQYLAVSPGLISWQEIVDTLNRQGHHIRYTEAGDEEFDALFPGARGMREMLEFWEEHTTFGPNAAEKIARAKELVPEGFTSFADWAKVYMRPPSPAVELTDAVLQRHVAAIMQGDMDALEANLAEDAVFLTPYGRAQGRRDVRRVFEHAREHMTPEYFSALDRVCRSVHPGVGYLVYRAEPFVSMGVDVWVVDNGKLSAQTYTAHPPLPFVKSFFEQHFADAADPSDDVTTNTKAVIDRHIEALGNLDAMLDNLAEDVVFITQAGTLEGREQIRRAFTSGIQLAPDGYGKAVETLRRAHHGRVGYLVYRAEPYVSLGTDTWIVRGDKIAVWAYAAHPMLSNLPAWLEAGTR